MPLDLWEKQDDPEIGSWFRQWLDTVYWAGPEEAMAINAIRYGP